MRCVLTWSIGHQPPLLCGAASLFALLPLFSFAGIAATATYASRRTCRRAVARCTQLAYTTWAPREKVTLVGYDGATMSRPAARTPPERALLRDAAAPNDPATTAPQRHRKQDTLLSFSARTALLSANQGRSGSPPPTPSSPSPSCPGHPRSCWAYSPA